MVSVVILSTLNTVTTKFWLKRWSEHNSDTGDNSDASYYLSVYLAIGIFFSIFVVARKATARMLCGLNASKKLHNEMLLAVTRSPMQFLKLHQLVVLSTDFLLMLLIWTNLCLMTFLI